MFTLKRRDKFGKGTNNKLRVNGYIPAVAYGGNLNENMHLAISLPDLQRMHREKVKEFDSIVDGIQYHFHIRSIMRDPRNSKIIHLDLRG